MKRIDAMRDEIFGFSVLPKSWRANDGERSAKQAVMLCNKQDLPWRMADVNERLRGVK